jgi:hypothetical protein
VRARSRSCRCVGVVADGGDGVVEGPELSNQGIGQMALEEFEVSRDHISRECSVSRIDWISYDRLHDRACAKGL